MRNFDVCDMVFLRLQPYKQVSLSMQGNRKLSLRFYGPYEDSSPIAYKLELTSAKVENSFCFSCFDVFEKKRLAWLSI